MFTVAFTRFENIKMQLPKLSLELKPDEDSVYLIGLPHASDVERNVALQKALAASTAELESMQATAGLDMMVKRRNFRQERESAGS
jgi:hypothetical protein